jgi:hypothetical protein
MQQRAGAREANQKSKAVVTGRPARSQPDDSLQSGASEAEEAIDEAATEQDDDDHDLLRSRRTAIAPNFDAYWRNSRERRLTRIYLAIAIVGTLLLEYLNIRSSTPKNENAVTVIFYGIPIAAALFFSFNRVSLQGRARDVWWSNVSAYFKAEKKRIRRAASGQELQLPMVWEYTQDRLNVYHQIATDQSQRSFRSAQVAGGAGFLVVIGAIVAAVAARRSLGVTITLASVGTIGAGLSAYINSTFMKSQMAAADQLRQFFTQPVEFLRTISAERLLDKLDTDHRSSAVQQIIKSMMPAVQDAQPKKEEPKS